MYSPTVAGPTQDSALIVAFPGWVQAGNRRQSRVFIEFEELCQLYGVDPRRTLNYGHPAAPAIVRQAEESGRKVCELHVRPEADYATHAEHIGLSR